MKNLGNRTGTKQASFTTKIQDIDKRSSGIEDMIEEMDTLVKVNVQFRKLFTQNIQEIWNTMKRLRIIRIEEGEESLLKGPENSFSKTIEENFPNIKEISIKVEA